MSFLDFGNNSLAVNLAIFVVLAVVIWLAGTRISFYADALTTRTGMGSAFMGMVFLAAATSSPEIGTTISAATAGQAQLAVNNAFGGVSMQTAILAIVDLLFIRGALTYFSPKPVLMLQGVFLILLIGMALTGIAAGDTLTILGVGMWSVLLLVVYILSLKMSQGYERQKEWMPENAPDEAQVQESVKSPKSQSAEDRYRHWSRRRLILFFALGTVIIFAVGYVLAQTATAIAAQTGLGTSFVGATLLAASTSLPELSATSAAVRLGNYSMAIANIFGSNSFMIMLVFLGDVFYRGGSILQQVDRSAMFGAATGILVTAIYLIGMLERRDRTVLRMGIDSAVVLAIYLGSLVILYQLR